MLHVQATDTSSFGLWRQHSLKKCLQVAAGWKSFSFLLNSAMQIHFHFLKNKHLSKQNNSLNSCLLCQLWVSTSSNGLLVHIPVGVGLFPNFCLSSVHTLQLRKISPPPPPPLQLSLSSLHSLPSFVMCGCCQSISVTPLWPGFPSSAPWRRQSAACIFVVVLYLALHWQTISICMNMCLPVHKMSTQWCGRDDSVF